MANRTEQLKRLFEKQIVLLDGSWGVLIQRGVKGEQAYRGERFAAHSRDIAGDPDVLNLTRPEVILDIHRRYFAAGAQIATTNTFTATRIGQADYALEDHAAEMSLEGARLARRAADEAGGFVAGALGPLNVSLSVSPKVDDASFRSVTFDQVRDAYAEQVEALVEGGVDVLMVETVFDTLNAKAAIAAALDVAPDVPRWISFTAIDISGRNLSGQTPEAFWASVEHADPLIVGVNCSLGAEQMRPYVEDLARVADTYVSCHPNAGLPNEFGEHDEQPEDTSRYLREFAESGLVNVVGGCCGTTPAHVEATAALVKGLAPRRVPRRSERPSFSGLELFEIDRDTGFVMIGERTNVTGSARFRRLVEAGDYAEAVAVAREQVDGGANLIDVNMDADLLDADEAMATFLNVIATEPEIARVPIMVDSSRFSAIETGLKCIQGKGIANSLSLKEGEEAFLAQARAVRRLGAAAVVMAFDEEGQAVEVERKVAICERAYRLLLAEGFHPADIVFDPNVLAVATGIEEHNGYAKAFIESLPLIKQRCPGRAHLAAGSRTSPSPSAATTPSARRCTPPSSTTRSARGSTWGSSTPASWSSTRTSRPSCSSGSRTCSSTGGRTRPSASSSTPRPSPGEATKREVDLSWREQPVDESALVRARPRDRRLHRGGRRGGAAGARAAAGRDRGAADGRDEDRRRPVRLRPHVPAAGREERPRDEARGRLPGAVHGGRARRRAAARPGQGRARDRQGRRPRHRQEHRRRRARLQQLRRRRPRRDGARGADPRHRRRAGRGRRRPLRPDHAVARRDGPRRRGDGAPRPRPAAADRRRDDLEAAHRRPDRPRVLAADGARPRRLPRGRRRSRACSTRRAPPSSTARTASSRSACASSTPRAPQAAAPARARARERRSASPSTSCRRRRSPGLRPSSPTSRRSRRTSTGSSSSTPGS